MPDFHDHLLASETTCQLTAIASLVVGRTDGLKIDEPFENRQIAISQVCLPLELPVHASGKLPSPDFFRRRAVNGPNSADNCDFSGEFRCMVFDCEQQLFRDIAHGDREPQVIGTWECCQTPAGICCRHHPAALDVSPCPDSATSPAQPNSPRAECSNWKSGEAEYFGNRRSGRLDPRSRRSTQANSATGK